MSKGNCPCPWNIRMSGHAMAKHRQSQIVRETSSSSKMNAWEASVTERGGGEHGPLLQPQTLPLRVNAQRASEGELEISLYPRQNRLSSRLEASSTGKRRVEVIGRGGLAFAASHPSLSGLRKEHSSLDHESRWKAFLACLSPVPATSWTK